LINKVIAKVFGTQNERDLKRLMPGVAEINALEELRFMHGRIYNYSAVVEAMHLSGFGDIEGGEGGPFNPRVPADIAERIKTAIQNLGKYH